MWLALELFAAVVIFRFAMRAHLTAFKPRPRASKLSTPPHLPYERHVLRDKGKVVSVDIRLNVPPGLYFKLREEGALDNLFKWLHVSKELQTSDEQFDQRIYVESDATAVQRLLRERSELRVAILEIFDASHALGLRRFRMVCVGDQLCVRFRPDSGELEPAPDKLVLPLTVVAEALRTRSPEMPRSHDSVFWRAAAMRSIPLAVACLAAVGVVRALLGRTDILNPWDFFASCIPIGLAIAAMFFLFTLAILARSSRAHVLLLEVGLVSALGFTVATFALAREVNVTFDTGPALQYELQGIGVEERCGRRGLARYVCRYYLHAHDPRPAQARQRQLELRIDRVVFEQLQGKSTATLVTRNGVLGYEWIVRVEYSVWPKISTTPDWGSR